VVSKSNLFIEIFRFLLTEFRVVRGHPCTPATVFLICSTQASEFGRRCRESPSNIDRHPK
jgi:hypothetical protein